MSDSSDNDENHTEPNLGELRQLIIKRGQIKSKLTRFNTYLGSLTNENHVTQVKLRLAKIEECWSDFENIQSQIELIDNSDAQTQERDSFETHYFDVMSQGQEYISLHDNTNISTSSNLNANSNTVPVTVNSQVKLPSINLPSFSGKYEEWLTFSDTYKSLIHDNDSITDIQKLHYLRSSLKGEALEVIHSLESTAINYNVAWNLLEERYKNSRLIIQKHIKSLFNLPSVEKEHASSIRQLLDGTLKHIRALKALDQPTEHWDALVVHLVTSKLNPSLLKDWELTTKSDELPTLKQLTDFLQRRCQILESSSLSSKTQMKPSVNNVKGKTTQQTAFMTLNNSTCRYCKGNHAIFNCQEFLKAPHAERIEKIKAAGICFNCLKPGHTVHQCRSGGCRKCSAKHNTLLHHEVPKSSQTDTPKSEKHNQTQEPDVQTTQPTPKSTSSLTSTSDVGVTQVLLSTAIVDVVSPYGNTTKCRALIDNGSQSSFMTENIAQLLGLQKVKQGIKVSGIGQNQIHVNGVAEATIKSCVSSYSTTLPFLIVPKISGVLPTQTTNLDLQQFPKHIQLADPTFSTPGRIDLLIGQEIFFDLLCIGQIRLKNLPTLQKTRLGWIVGGRIINENQSQTFLNTTCLFTSTPENISEQLQRFWCLEEPTNKIHLTKEELSCEEHYKMNTKRDVDGRYAVKMPLREDPSVLGESKEIAKRRFFQIEKRLEKEPKVKEQYRNFMSEYEQLGHMEKIEDTQTPNTAEYFLPHHPVLKTSSTTTKLRVVFDASAKTTLGNSLNDIQLVGPTIQNDLFSIILRFRLHTVVITGDLEKMYRQINIDSSQRDLLKIFWRDDPSQPLQTYRLNTVTYGTASAGYLATRTLHQLAEDEERDFPEASKIVLRDFYVDDLITGTDTIEDGLHLQAQLIEMLKRGKFNLRKWNSNSEELLKHLPTEMRERQPLEFPQSGEPVIKTLGLWWNAVKDVFQFKYSDTEEIQTIRLTKRIVLSQIAKLFDPLGLVAPITIRAKMQLQELWKHNLEWDESLPMHLHTQWTTFLNCLKDLNELRITRQVTLPQKSEIYELHAFSDASEKAYGAVVYLRQQDATGRVVVSLLCAKSRVAPVKTVTLPRLELCGALLSAELTDQVIKALQLTEIKVTYWTDSNIVLAWLATEPAHWVTFVANRVSRIQDLTGMREWCHINTKDNPADLISRGTTTGKLAKSELWWHGPSWMSQDEEQWPQQDTNVTLTLTENVPDKKQVKVATFISTNENLQNDTLTRLIERYSSFIKLTRVLALCLRFYHNTTAPEDLKIRGVLTPEEINRAEIIIIKFVQKQSFPNEYKSITTSKEISKSSQLLSLTPFLDKDGLIRVGGRIEEAELSFDEKHPIVLPKNHRITDIIAREEHLRQLHCGPQALLYAIRQKYWPINGRNLTRKITRHCIRCFKVKPKESNQLMGSLPSSRVNPARPFLHCAVDYCGPFQIKCSLDRGTKTRKSYVAVFVCLATKAVHFELVSDLTTEAFLAALKRFVSRRGIASSILSDNGKTFVGANRQLKELYQFFKNEASEITRKALNEGIKWTFNPPYSPHMGGIFEAAVKSLKYHLRRIVGATIINFEDLTTVLTQIEAVLNSRPLTPMSNNPNDLSVLSPAHFLIGGPITAHPEPSLEHIPEQRLNRWQRSQRLLQHFWSRWSIEYLNNLQQRNKWKYPSSNMKVGDLVLLKEDNNPPFSWPMGRILTIHPGRDKCVRVVTVKTSSGEVTRNINKLCVLPIDD